MPYIFKQHIVTSVLGIGLLAAALTACTSHKPEESGEEQGWVLTDSLLHSLRIDTATAHPIESEVSLTGKIAPNEDEVARIFPMVSGVVTNMKAQSGDLVTAGQTLAVLHSAEMAGYTADETVNKNALATAKRNLDVAESFYKSGLSSQKELEEARAAYATAEAQLNRSSTVLSINGGGNAKSDYLVKSPITGFVIARSGAEHMQWRPDNTEPIFVIANLHTVWAMINVYESDIANVREGDNVAITTLSYPDKIFNGKVQKVYNVLDPDNKVMKARVSIDNPDYLLKPEMFVSVKAQRHASTEGVSIPSRGIIFDNDKQYVLVLTHGEPKVAVREITVGRTVEDRAYVTSGLKEGDEIVASRQVFIYESLKK
ncbi:membrane fusion protein, cobalt-zinc-cadmium efflux system [Chitinophaga costaii]|uniref:Membrane fusion protein, cobalt-zinc-cadmium efflux system n=1 Tax=Chitinophaga costaii TaxID=1335309 RepID=A0A1C4CT12_9BACT|nr:efflux RND transporter periplasmic adaptor subunit [Chitinophaga costaii]PUZ26963.1 efflux RND transporter periplasmic adaptor subunit [Chitinophaga costaii]SCC22161.1 membrane fusion protein, cobalt-zinc-cadmium efflux system [Chitinophaga costaii]